MAAECVEAEVVAKVADFGLSRPVGPFMKGRQVDNPIWLAPVSALCFPPFSLLFLPLILFFLGQNE